MTKRRWSPKSNAFWRPDSDRFFLPFFQPNPLEGRGRSRHVTWTPKDIPDQSGRTFVITGANSGIGFHAAKHLVARGAHVVLACRRLDAAQAAAAKMDGPGKAEAMHLDLEDLTSVDAFAKAAPDAIDVLVNNAGIMAVPYRLSPQGFEAQWAVNVVGHARLTKLLLPRIQDRVVTLASLAHRHGAIRPETFRAHDDYNPWQAYAQSKLGDLIFALELDKHLRAQGSPVRSVAAHPGVTLTRLHKDMSKALLLPMLFYVPFLQGGDKGSWPTLLAATADVDGGTYWGPRGRREHRGPPIQAHVAKRAMLPDNVQAVWENVWSD